MKFDDSAFYRRQFSAMWQGVKSVDIVAVSPTNEAYLIEVKDYRLRIEERPSELPQMVAEKVLHTLGAQVAGRLNANDATERDQCSRVCAAAKVRVVLHMEQPPHQHGIFRPFDPANIQLKLRQLMKPVDAHPLVVSSGQMASVPWTVRSLALLSV